MRGRTTFVNVSFAILDHSIWSLIQNAQSYDKIPGVTIRVAFDMTPTLGTRTGIGNVVAHLYQSINDSSSVELAPYTISYKAKSYKDELPTDNEYINLPAKLLMSLWRFTNLQSFDNSFEKLDLWHATNYLAPPTKNPLLITIHDVTMLKYPELVPAQVRALAPIISKRLRQGAHVHVPASAIKQDVIEYFSDSLFDEDHVHVVPFSMPDLSQSPASAKILNLCKGDPYILCIGALDPRKNHARLIESFELVHHKFPHFRLFLVGPDGPARPAIDAAMANISREAREKIVITGNVSQGDRTWLLKNTFLVAYPSLYEGFGLPLLEAMTAHAPIVTTREGSLEEVAANAAHFVDAKDTDDIARGIIDVLDSQDLRDKLITAGKNRVSDFSWHQSAKMLTDVYSKIIKSAKDS